MSEIQKKLITITTYMAFVDSLISVFLSERDSFKKLEYEYSHNYLLACHSTLFLQGTGVSFVHSVVHAIELSVVFLIKKMEECEAIVV